ncbi:MAG: phosphotransferase [Candidatus Eremiobacteraeota bacterium]|nr:phosphotransferase [Candidatus Eremiobacteraeota bacterium]
MPKKPIWAADIEIAAPLAASLVAAQFPEFAGSRIEPLGIGWDNAAFLIDDRAVFRFPRRRIATKLIEREIAILPSIASWLPIPISSPRYVGTPSALYPYAFAGYDQLLGNTACTVRLANQWRAMLAAPLGNFLRTLHGIDTAPLSKLGLPPDEFGRFDHERCLRMTRERLPAISASGLIENVESFARWLEVNPPILLENHERRLVHGDLYARHVLLADSGWISGVIDWGDIHYGDPATDIAIAHSMLPAAAHSAFRDAYGTIDDRTWHNARYRAICSAIIALQYGISVNDTGMRELGVTALQLIGEAL